MADYTTSQNPGRGGWIIGAIVAALTLLFIVFATGSPPLSDGATTTTDPDGFVRPAPVSSQ